MDDKKAVRGRFINKINPLSSTLNDVHNFLPKRELSRRNLQLSKENEELSSDVQDMIAENHDLMADNDRLANNLNIQEQRIHQLEEEFEAVLQAQDEVDTRDMKHADKEYQLKFKIYTLAAERDQFQAAIQKHEEEREKMLECISFLMEEKKRLKEHQTSKFSRIDQSFSNEISNSNDAVAKFAWKNCNDNPGIIILPSIFGSKNDSSTLSLQTVQFNGKTKKDRREEIPLRRASLQCSAGRKNSDNGPNKNSNMRGPRWLKDNKKTRSKSLQRYHKITSGVMDSNRKCALENSQPSCIWQNLLKNSKDNSGLTDTGKKAVSLVSFLNRFASHNKMQRMSENFSDKNLFHLDNMRNTGFCERDTVKAKINTLKFNKLIGKASNEINLTKKMPMNHQKVVDSDFFKRKPPQIPSSDLLVEFGERFTSESVGPASRNYETKLLVEFCETQIGAL
jgi:hypothetical protein